MTARSSPHYAAVVRAKLARTRDRRLKLREQIHVTHYQIIRQRHEIAEHCRDINPYLNAYASALRDEPKTEEQKATRWGRIWGRRD